MTKMARLRLALTEPDHLVPRRQEMDGAGFSVEQVALDDDAGFEYAWSSERYYLALHDLRLRDGEVRVDGLPPARTRDLRDTFTFIPPGCAVSGWSKLELRANAFIVLSFDPAAMDEALGARFAWLDPSPRLYFRSEALRAPVARLGQVLEQGSADPLHIATLAALAVVELLGTAPPEAPGRLSPLQLAAAIDYLESHLADGTSLADLAAAAGLSRFHFSRAFKATTGQSPYAFALARRVDRAEELLASEMPLGEIATNTGFAGVPQLRRAFRALKGRSPTSGRRTGRRE